MLKVGNISVNEKVLKRWSWKRFQRTFAGKLYGFDIRRAYKFVTGKTAPDGKTNKST